MPQSDVWKRSVVTLLCLWGLAFCGPVASVQAETGQADAEESELEEAPRVVYHGPRYRYDQMGVFERVGYDVVAIPAGVVDWSRRDWLTFGAVTGATGVMMLPTDPSLDVRLDNWIDREVDPWFPDIWKLQYQAVLWGGLAVGGLGTWGYAEVTGNDKLAQAMSLMGESVAVSQVFHLSLKFLTGREGPRDEQGRGIFHGPPGAVEYFPAGFPSGHFATLYAVFGSAQTYWQFPLAWDVTGHILMGALASTHVLTHRHYLSEIIAGSAMGYAISQWVVRHRSTRYEYRDGQPVRLTLVPTPRGVNLSFQLSPEIWNSR